MNVSEYKLQLYETLESIYPHKKAHNQIAVRCPLCGDSRKHHDSTHFGIKINVTDDKEPVMYNCFLCNESGIMTSDILRALEVYDLEMTTGIQKFNKAVMKDIKRMGFKENSVKMKIPMPEDNQGNRIKKAYLENRLGRSFTYEELVQMKTIFSLKDFLVANDIDRLTTTVEKSSELNAFYVGWVTVRNEKINFRQVIESKFRRYEKYEIYKGLDNTQKFYAIPTKVDIMSNEPITLVLSEGILDVWGAYYNVFDQNIDNMIYCAACGSGFVSVVRYFLKKGFMDNLNLIILSDNEPHRTKKFYTAMFKEFDPWIDNISVYYNTHITNGKEEKDFGVPKSQTKVKVIKL